MKIVSRIIAFGLLAVSLSGCIGETMRIDPITDLGSIDRSRGRKISAQASGFQLFAVLPIGTNSRHEQALEKLREQAGDDVIADVSISESWYYAILGTVLTTAIEARAYPRTP